MSSHAQVKAIIDAMRAGGVDADTIVSAVLALVSCTEEKRQATSTERVRRHREMKRNETLQDTVTCNVSGNVSLPLKEKSPLNPLKENNPLNPSSSLHSDEGRASAPAQPKPKKRVLTVLPRNWSPAGDDFDTAQGEGLTLEDIETEGAKFRDHWLSTGESKADWSATWRNWCRRFVERKRQDAEAERRRSMAFPAQRRIF